MYDGLRNLEVPRRSRHPRARRAAKLGALGMAIVAVLLTATGIFVYKKVNDALRKTHRDLPTDARLPDEPMNILVLGSDRRDVIDPAERKKSPEYKGGGGQRADTIILIHVSAKARKAVAIHFPRDLRVNIPGRGLNKINAAYAFGGPDLMIKTVRAFSGLKIHHYVEINFSSFRKIVDAIGGVDICVTQGYQDRRSGLHIPKAGCYNMDGKTSLAFVRARYIDPRADLGRIERQQLFMRALMGKVKSVGFLLNPTKVLNLADAIQEGVITSKDVDLGLAKGVAGKLAGDQKRVDFRIVPGAARYFHGISYVFPNLHQARRLFDALSADSKLPNVGKTGLSLPKRRDVTIRILNGTGVAGLAARESGRLRSEGFNVRSVDTTPKKVRQTTITFLPGGDLKARLLELEYPGAVVRVSTAPQPADLVLTLGTDVLAEASATPST